MIYHICTSAALASARLAGARTDQLFPHRYGPINLDALVDVVALASFLAT